ncbi:MAG: uracil phosphoribosyltransferase [bacterium]|jgi:uracil phosphoribosyltransferase|nr:uracil phosphoribosyltransferase [Bacteroidales bacterium]MDD5963120.1 uracil phosphoribosyltransferase [bacterium]MDD7236397.1 uracil phosphoribosyltransferase [bacterium]MDY2650385.1 uracil phosphoribosyltransferase [Candidatus Egerieousia sp.]MDY5319498.1 uracil phosphoribosyltransferase [Candidatus Egerieousia sp.]
MKIYNFGEQKSVMNRFIAELRDKQIQKDSLRFRRNLERIGELFAYEISKQLKYEERDVQTPLGIAKCQLPADKVVVASILRAGLPLHQGVLNIFDSAQNAFIAAYRKYGKDNKFKIQMEYATMPSIEGKTVVLVDPMLATGSSIILAYNKICTNGEPLHTHIVAAIASRESLSLLSKNLPHSKVTLWVGAVDEELTNKSYIVPGLGDAGDLAFGEKL